MMEERKEGLDKSIGLDWAGFNVRLHQHSIGYPGDSFTDQKTQPTASKYWREKLASHRPEEAQPTGASHRVTSEPLKKKKNPITVGQTQRDKAPHSRLACTSPV